MPVNGNDGITRLQTRLLRGTALDDIAKRRRGNGQADAAEDDDEQDEGKQHVHERAGKERDEPLGKRQRAIGVRALLVEQRLRIIDLTRLPKLESIACRCGIDIVRTVLLGRDDGTPAIQNDERQLRGLRIEVAPQRDVGYVSRAVSIYVGEHLGQIRVLDIAFHARDAIVAT